MIWDDHKIIGFDVETSGEKPEYALQPWRFAQGKAWVTSFVWIRKTPTEVSVRGGLCDERDHATTVTMMREMLEEAIRDDCHIVTWYGIFDIAWLIAYGLGDLVMRVKWLDGMLIWRHYFIEPEYETDRPNKKSYSLKTAVAELLPMHAGYEEDVDFHDPSPAARKKLHDYNVRDVIFTMFIAKQFYNKLEPMQVRAMLLEAQCLPLAADANLTGILVDAPTMRHLSAKLDKDAAAHLDALSAYGVTEEIVRSPTKMAALLFDDWKLPVYKENTGKKTGKKTRATNKETLHELAFIDPRAKQLREYREALNNKTKFAATPLAAAAYNEDGRAHPEAHVFGTYSGRLTYSSSQGKNKDKVQTGWALHQEKRGAEFRDVAQAPEGYDLMEFDASGQEFRWMAIASGDPVMLAMCAPGEDAHSFMGSRIAGVDYHQLMAAVQAGEEQAKADRQLGKVGNLSLQYRTTPPTLRRVARVQYNIPMTTPESVRVHSTYIQTYRRVPVYWDVQIASVKRLGYVETFGGRRVQVQGDWGGRFGWSMGSTAINYRIQGTGADQKYLALAVLKPYLTKHAIKFAWDLHDGIYFWVPSHLRERAAVEMKAKLDTLPYAQAWGLQPPIPLPWDCKVGRSWGSLKEYKYV